MDLYFSPLACSMATRIAFYEAGGTANYLEVDPRTKVVQTDGSDFRRINSLGLVPTLRTDDGAVLTENAAILQYVADRFPDAGIGAAPGMERSRLHQWLCFIGTELHKGLFVPLLDRSQIVHADALTSRAERQRRALDIVGDAARAPKGSQPTTTAPSASMKMTAVKG